MVLYDKNLNGTKGQQEAAKSRGHSDMSDKEKQKANSAAEAKKARRTRFNQKKNLEDKALDRRRNKQRKTLAKARSIANLTDDADINKAMRGLTAGDKRKVLKKTRKIQRKMDLKNNRLKEKSGMQNELRSDPNAKAGKAVPVKKKPFGLLRNKHNALIDENNLTGDAQAQQKQRANANRAKKMLMRFTKKTKKERTKKDLAMMFIKGNLGVAVIMALAAVFLFMNMLFWGGIVAVMLSHPQAIQELYVLNMLGDAKELGNVSKDVKYKCKTIVKGSDDAAEGKFVWYGLDAKYNDPDCPEDPDDDGSEVIIHKASDTDGDSEELTDTDASGTSTGSGGSVTAGNGGNGSVTDTGASTEDAKAGITAAQQSANMKTAFNYFVKIGYTKEAAAVICGTWMWESTFDPTNTNGSSGAFGVGQWLGGRKDSLIAETAKNKKNYKSLDGQLWYGNWEINQKYYSNLLVHNGVGFKSRTDIEQMMNDFITYFEGVVPSDTAQYFYEYRLAMAKLAMQGKFMYINCGVSVNLSCVPT